MGRRARGQGAALQGPRSWASGGAAGRRGGAGQAQLASPERGYQVFPVPGLRTLEPPGMKGHPRT